MESALESPRPEMLRSMKNFVIDMDGVLYRGQEPMAGAQEFINHLLKRDVPFILATNNSTLTPGQYVAKLLAMGIEVPEERILTSGQATAMYLSRVSPHGATVYVIGEEGLASALREHGFLLANKGIDFVVVGLDRELTYDKLKLATLAIRAGAQFVGTNPDTTLPTEEGLHPGTGAILAALEAATGVAPLIVGKPQPTLPRLAMERLGVTPRGTAMIGDRLETDILAGKEAGLITVLLLTGISQPEDLETSPLTPDLIFKDICSFHEAWRRQQDR